MGICYFLFALAVLELQGVPKRVHSCRKQDHEKNIFSRDHLDLEFAGNGMCVPAANERVTELGPIWSSIALLLSSVGTVQFHIVRCGHVKIAPLN